MLYLLLEKKRAIASYTKALEFKNGKCFRRVTEEGYIAATEGARGVATTLGWNQHQ
ncbi:MAG TPA: hypothetical protein V6D30_03370 [Leptolyngbyaceae cyanobacterium]